MGTSRNPLSENKIFDLLSVQQVAVGTQNGNPTDLRDAMAGAHDLREDVTDLALAIDVDLGAASTVDITIQHRTNANGAWVNYVTLAQINTNSGLYVAELRDLRRWVRASAVVAGATVTIAVIGYGNRARRMPVRQRGTELAVTVVNAP